MDYVPDRRELTLVLAVAFSILTSNSMREKQDLVNVNPLVTVFTIDGEAVFFVFKQ